DHKAVNAISSQVLHVAINETCTFAVQNTVAVPNHGAYGCSSACQSPLPYTLWFRSHIGARVCSPESDETLIWIRKLCDRYLILVRVPRPGTIHQAVGFILLVPC